MKNPYSVGKSIYLRAPERDDLDGKWYEWLSDPEISQYLADRTWPNNKEKQKDFFESFNNKSFSERLVLAICLKENNKHIGICNLSSINYIHRYADIAFIVGDKKYRNGQIAIETLSLLIEIAFKRLNLLNLKSVHMSSNPHTPLLEKLFGFKEIGKYEKLYNYKGEYVDCIHSQLSRKDWENRNTKNN